ncbi:tetratricopeptide repeat protein [Arcicella lustrica]|uniref:Tetratricopeptide repeat protein n=1 Tax=Arcicella lustrica TaxID=2984196 RepID=A0ABU5SIF9_9BACT|nr:tetratricopeptide repeat protein [Arcicella sp. DC25W]MEA5427072.1 tetratricopeptide repeat protein [Arcicella sp. DC25W]
MIKYKMLLKTFWKALCLCFVLMSSFDVFSQDAQLGVEYLKAGEYEKARTIFQKLAKNKETAKDIYKPYLETLIKLKNWDEAEKFVKRQIKNSESNQAKYLVDLGRLYQATEKKEEAKKNYDLAIDKVKANDDEMIDLVNYFVQQQQTELAIQTIEVSRVFGKSEDKYAVQLANLFRMQGKVPEMIEEYLKFGLATENQEMVQSILQDELKEDKEIEELEKILYAKVQKYPQTSYYTDILIWHLVQKKDFYKAFVQARALDKRYRKEGAQVTELGFMAHQNKDFVNSGKIFEYLIKEYPRHQNYPLWRRMLISAKEEVIKTTYPINQSDIRLLIAEYTKMLEELGTNQRTLEALRSKGLLYAFYLNEKDTAIAVLEKAIKLANTDQIFVDKCKLDLGDIFLLKSEPWEATLLYSQVEKSQKDSPMGYEAKLRNAKLAYFRGDFELSKEVLDILKQATTREIANDAMELSLLIQENTGFDSTEAALKDYSAVELLLFQHRNNEAIAKLVEMEKVYRGNPIMDDLIFLRANIYLKQGDVEKGVKDLEFVIQNFPHDIKGDDALYLLAKTYQEVLNQSTKAMKLYQELLIKYPGSIYSAEARKRFRNLRGDTIN